MNSVVKASSIRAFYYPVVEVVHLITKQSGGHSLNELHTQSFLYKSLLLLLYSVPVERKALSSIANYVIMMTSSMQYWIRASARIRAAERARAVARAMATLTMLIIDAFLSEGSQPPASQIS